MKFNGMDPDEPESTWALIDCAESRIVNDALCIAEPQLRTTMVGLCNFVTGHKHFHQ